MASRITPLEKISLTPQQQTLLFAALNSNKPSGYPAHNTMTLSPATLDGSPVQPYHGVQDYLDNSLHDYDPDFNGADSSFDFTFNDSHNDSIATGDQPDAPSTTKSDSVSEQDSPDKRSHPDDDEEENGAKRRESEEKVSKKPGRKPLTTEPTSKRKAQNRAAQRAFRERKEKHLKDLETKVDELTKASDAVNNENQMLRSKLDKMTVELSEYKKRVTTIASTTRSPMPATSSRAFGPPMNNINDVNFHFEFPKFGVLPGAPTTASSSPTNHVPSLIKRSSTDQSREASQDLSPGNSTSYSQIALDSQMKDDLANITASIFNPTLANSHTTNGSRSSFDSHPGTSHSSPSASSHSNLGGPSSSCATSPEPFIQGFSGFTQSPNGFKALDTMTTIGEESANLQSNQGMGHLSNTAADDFNWLPQNNFQFDPQLFGDYRDPTDNPLSGVLDDSLFNDVIDADFLTPYNLPLTVEPVAKKPNLIAEIDAAKNSDELDSNGQLLTCNKIWERLQNCPKVQNGDFDLDGLCSELQKKAKCSGTSAVVDENDFHNVMKKYLGKNEEDVKMCKTEFAKQKAMAAQKALGGKTLV